LIIVACLSLEQFLHCARYVNSCLATETGALQAPAAAAATRGVESKLLPAER